jgi:hypothetical protein
MANINDEATKFRVYQRLTTFRLLGIFRSIATISKVIIIDMSQGG